MNGRLGIASLLHWRPSVGLLVMTAAAAGIAAACSDSESGLRCGDGTALQGDVCVASADGGLSSGSVTAPTFGGVSAVAPASPTALLVTWDPAKDERTPVASLIYRVYVGKAGEELAFTTPIATTPAGATFVRLDGLDTNADYVVTVRAVNQAGLEDPNVVQKVGRPTEDTAPPTFGGLKTAGAGGDGAVLLTWDAATDDLSPPRAISYAVYAATKPQKDDLAAPLLITEPGATSVVVRGLVGSEITRFFVVRARDASDNMDGNEIELAAQPGKDLTPPVFGGCTAAIATSASDVTISWNAAVDETTPTDKLRYEVFDAVTSGAQDFTKPTAKAEGATSVKVSNVAPGSKHYFVCRARDLGDNLDTNRVERTTTTATDPHGPTFLGLTPLSGDDFSPSKREVTLRWAPATDDRTPPENIVYDVYEAGSSQGQDFSAPPRASSAPGATSVTVTNLTPNTTLYWVVRARDEGLNHDDNTVEASGTTDVSFSQNVQPVFNHYCAVVGCHVPGNPASGLILTQGFAYEQLVGVPSMQHPDLKRVAPGDATYSYLHMKIVGSAPADADAGAITLMPAQATGSALTATQKSTIETWINQGAADN